MNSIIILLTLLQSITCSESDVITLTRDSFNELVIDSPLTWWILFTGDNCEHCNNIAPKWEKAATALKGKKIIIAKTKDLTPFNK